MKKAKLLLKPIICIYAVYCLIFEFGTIKKEILDALTVWLNIILPSVFPYLVLSQYISNSNIINGIEKTGGNFIGRILRISPCCVKAVICSLVCGYPSGAVCTSALYEQGLLTKDEAQRLICFTNNAGPLFLISAVGGAMLGSVKDGFAIYAIQHISAFIYGFLTSYGKAKPKKAGVKFKTCKGDLCSAVSASVTIIINICGFMIAAYVMSAGVMIAFDKLNITHLNPAHINVFVRGFFEISSGVKSMCMLEYNNINFAIICAFVSWSGLSVIMQIKSASKDIISFGQLITAKAMQAISSFWLGLEYKTFFSKQHSLSDGDFSLKTSLVFTIVLFSFYIFNKIHKKAFR